MPTSLIIVLAAVGAVLVVALVGAAARRGSRGTDLLGSQLAAHAHPAPAAGITPGGTTTGGAATGGATPGGAATGGAALGGAALESQVADLLRRGRKIEAVKVYRQVTGATLLDAKNAVERGEGGRPLGAGRAGGTVVGAVPPGAAALDDATWQRLREQVRLGRKIQAI